MAMPTASEWQTMLEMAEVLVASNMLPKAITKKEQAVAVILKGHELGLQPMQSFALIHVISGKPTASSEFMLGLLAKGGVTWSWIEKGDNGQAIIEFRRANFEPVRGTFTKEEAQQAKLTGKDTWRNYPANMLRARAVANGARMIGPDLLMGMSYTPEEMGADVDENEDPITSSSQQQPPAEERIIIPELDQVFGNNASEEPANGTTELGQQQQKQLNREHIHYSKRGEFILKAGKVIDDIDDQDQVAFVFDSWSSDGFSPGLIRNLVDVPSEARRDIYAKLKEKRAEVQAKRTTKLAVS
jgi:hypothetical protein